MLLAACPLGFKQFNNLSGQKVWMYPPPGFMSMPLPLPFRLAEVNHKISPTFRPVLSVP